MNILFIIDVNIFMFIKWSYRFLQYIHNMWVNFMTLEHVNYIMCLPFPELNKVRLFVYCSYIQPDTWDIQAEL